jgi:hypothetical protein
MLDSNRARILCRLALDYHVGGLLDPIREIYFSKSVGYALWVRVYIYNVPLHDLLPVYHAERKVAGSRVDAYRLHLYFLHNI